MNVDDKLTEYKKQSCFVTISENTSEQDSEFYGIIRKTSRLFVMLQNIDDWHDNGILIFPKARIQEIKKSEISDEKLNVLLWNGINFSSEYENISLESYQSLFESLKRNMKTVFIDDDESADMGLIKKVTEKIVVLKGIDGTGKWLDEEVEIPLATIVKISVDDEYSRVLSKFAQEKGLRLR